MGISAVQAALQPARAAGKSRKDCAGQQCKGQQATHGPQGALRQLPSSRALVLGRTDHWKSQRYHSSWGRPDMAKKLDPQNALPEYVMAPVSSTVWVSPKAKA